MRTTVTLDPDTEQLIRRHMRERGISFKQAINDAIRRSEPGASAAFQTETAAMGEPVVNLDQALRIAADLEDEELVRKMRTGS